MKPLEYLENRVSQLGNHFQKYLYTINKYKDSLIEALDQSGKLMQVDLWRHSFSLEEEMTIIKDLSSDKKTQVQYLSCYYAFQYLHMNFRNLDVLAMELAAGGTPTEVYHRFMMKIDSNFTELNKFYIRNLLDIHLPHKKRPKFFICSVGTRADQDDIDLGIVTEDDADVTELNLAFKKITQYMLVYATPLHLYLSESVGQKRYTKTVSECVEMIEKKVQNVVVISELLNANMIFGSQTLFKRFQREVTERYFYHAKKDSRYHEFFLRGILGEARAMLLSPPQSDAVSPKHDVIRILKSILSARKIICRVREANAWDIISSLYLKEPHLNSEYQYLFNSLSFLEMFKFLLQMYVIQEDTFRLGDIDRRQLDIVAEKMGYESIGTVSAWDQLIISYYNYIKDVRKLCSFLLKDTSIHLSSISSVVGMLKSSERRDKDGDFKGSLPKELIANARFFAGTKYWEDVLGLIESDPLISKNFFKGFDDLNAHERDKVIKSYVEWSGFAPITTIRLLTIIGKKQSNMLGETVFAKMSREFLKFIKNLPNMADRLSRIYSHYPEYIHEFLQILPEAELLQLEKILTESAVNEKVKEYHYQLKELCTIHKWSGQYFHRFFYRVISNHPEHLTSLTRPSKLSKIATGLLAMVDVYPGYSEKKKVLGDYYDLEFLKVGIGTMRGVDLITTNREFTEFCDNYIKELFHICEEEVEHESVGPLPSTDEFTILVAGGHGRMQAYDDDYDLIAIVANEDPEVLKHATRIVTRMNREILKRGLLPHYRLAGKLGSFVNTIDQVNEYLLSQDDETFIDLSQLLGARMIIGSEEMEKVINREILDRFVFKNKNFYIKRMIGEIGNRQEVEKKQADHSCNIKETLGGLRDIEAIALMLKAYQETTMPLSESFFVDIESDFKEISEDLTIITESMYFLRTIRNLYRLMVSADEEILQDYLPRLAGVFREGQQLEWSTSELIMKKLRLVLKRSSGACSRIMRYLEKKI